MCSIFGVFDIKTDAVELRKKALELSRLMRHPRPRLVRYLRLR
ncbi:asparagine synthetase B [Citrobacter koseri]|uniref:Asparagine synthetase B n=1 Tax=Citrobacter koseri TaxID=545 RepID=A0A2X2X587_CITKO|nr:asparagine synthetase B [Citrobacter koseri]